MKITCHSCSAKYTVSDDKVQGKTVKMKCRKCGATIVVGGAGAAAGGEASTAQEVGADPAADLAPGSYLVNVNDGDQRTMTLQEVVDAYNTGVVNADTYVWTDGMSDWEPLSDNSTISGSLHSQNGVTNGNYSPAPAMPSYDAPPQAYAAAGDSARPAARKDAGKRSDLFGGGGGGFADAGGGMSAVQAGAAGKRDENSVLFSLSALTSATAPSKSSNSATKDDSGLIDLKALAASAAPPTASSQMESAALFPLGAPMLGPPPVAAAPAMAPVYAEPKKSNMVLPLVLGGFLAVGAIGAVFFLLKGSPPPPAPAPVQTTVAAEPTPAATAAPTETASAAPAATETAAASASATAAPVAIGGKWHPPAGKGAPAAGGKTPAAGGTPPAGGDKPKPTGGACACPPGDLMCAMQKCAGKK